MLRVRRELPWIDFSYQPTDRQLYITLFSRLLCAPYRSVSFEEKKNNTDAIEFSFIAFLSFLFSFFRTPSRTHPVIHSTNVPSNMKDVESGIFRSRVFFLLILLLPSGCLSVPISFDH